MAPWSRQFPPPHPQFAKCVIGVPLSPQHMTMYQPKAGRPSADGKALETRKLIRLKVSEYESCYLTPYSTAASHNLSALTHLTSEVKRGMIFGICVNKPNPIGEHHGL